MVCLTSVVYSLCSGENVKPAAVKLSSCVLVYNVMFLYHPNGCTN